MNGATFELGLEDATAQSQVILTVTPTRPGVVKIKGVYVGFRQGVRYGNQVTGPDLTVTSSQPSSP